MGFIKFGLAVCSFALCLGPLSAHAAAGIDTTTSDLPFSIGGTQVLDLTTNGLNIVRGSLTITGCTLSGAGAFTSNNCPLIVNNSSAATAGSNWAGSFTGGTYGVYSKGAGWAGYFDGPTMLNGATTVNGTTAINGATNVNGNLTVTGTAVIPTMSGNTNVAGSVNVTQPSQTWTGNFTGSGGYGVYAYGTVWAAYFNGPVNVNGNETVNGNDYINGYVCLNNDCRNVWPSSTNTTVVQTAPVVNAGCPGGYALNAISNNSPVCTTVSTKTYPQLYQCPVIAIYGSDGGGTGCVGQVTTSSTCNTYSVSGNHTHTSSNGCSAL